MLVPFLHGRYDKSLKEKMGKDKLFVLLSEDLHL